MIPIIRTEPQGSEDWKTYRNSRISATNIAPIMGVSPFKTALMLYEEKLNLRPPEPLNQKMSEGMALEEHARNFMNRVHHTDYEPIVLQHGDINYLMASLDGMNSKGEILEIKCGRGSHELAKQGIIPEYYLSQLNCQMECSNTTQAYYCSYRSNDDCVLITVKRDDAFIEKMLVEVDLFYKNLLNFIPPAACDRDFIHKDSKEWRLHAEIWKDTKKQLSLLAKKEELLREELIKMCEGQSSQGNGVRISRTISKGRVKFTNIKELEGVDLEPYRGKNIETWRFTETKEEG